MTSVRTREPEARALGAAQLWIGTSWKMNKGLAESRRYARELADYVSANAIPGVQPFIIPSFTALAATRDELGDDSPVLLGVQNAHWEDHGAWTGEVSVAQAKDAGAQLVEIGHSERREHFGETLETTRLKVAAALAHGLVPLLCIGESAETKRAGDSSRFILEQAAGALDGLTDEQLRRVLIAYEPIWAIGEHGRPATVEELRKPFADLGREYGGSTLGLLYGGSVNTDNAEELLGIDHVTGLFIGRAAWQLPGYVRILELAAAHPKASA
ncbi:L-erythrulose 1-phosphate isomerase [Mycolicibacterium goodii]|uniref:triose-phosphate isomerase n=1 Tax=Mycolicibacterium goodii TaxID=134601 RepID=UPI001BDD46C8|nr:triose-phosphate isomerase [Mycolicibacterium goodii]MBU8807416.1 L-erythrulose 1-phosphate isomerase [Mycolicibacterium goodii]MBU8814486.1 L-erythrulose 1-phosphate isomerase [Mycolicibacterium goodii]ULN47733.1 L-erythrulose 1-phosphate isomerase [Mycolicibacterium goodii]